MTVDTKRTRRSKTGSRKTPPSAPPPKATSLRAYAKHRDVSTEAVRKAIASSRLVKSIVVVDGTPQIADVALADQEWAANTDLTRAHDDVKARAAAAALVSSDTSSHVNTPAPGRETDRGRVLTFQEPQPHGGSLKREQLEPDVTIAAASAAEKHWRSKKAELDYKKAAAELVDAKDITARFVDMITTSRMKLLGLPSKAKSQLPHLSLDDLNALDAIVREALEELAS